MKKRRYEHISRTELMELINEWILNKRDRELTIKHMLDGVCFSELCEYFCLSSSRAKQIYHDCCTELEKHLLERRR